MNIKELKAERVKRIEDARKIYSKAETEKRGMTAEENETFDKLMADSDKFRADAEKLEKENTAEEKRSQQMKEGLDWMGQSAGRQTEPEEPGANPGSGAEPEKIEVEFRSMPRYNAHGGVEPSKYEKVLIGPDDTDTLHRKIYARSRAETRSLYNKWLKIGKREMADSEYRDLQNDIDVSGGFLQSPIQMVQELLKFVDNDVILRNKARVFRVPTAVSLGVPSLDTDIDDAAWTAEIAAASEDGTSGPGMAFGRRELHPHPLSKQIKVSNKLLRTAILSPESIVRDRLAYKFGVAMEKGYMLGSGSNQPLGIFVASTMGIDTSRDVSGVNTTTSIAADTIYSTFYNVKPQYQRRGEWLFHRTVLMQIMQLKDGIGHYLFQPSLVAGQPDMLVGRPVNQSEYAPNTMTTGQYVGMFGDFSFYWIADALSLEVQRLDELYAQTNQVGFIGRAESDGMPVLAEAWSRMKLN